MGFLTVKVTPNQKSYQWKLLPLQAFNESAAWCPTLILPMKFEQTNYFVNSLLQQLIRVNDYPYKSKSTMLLKYHK